MCEKLLADDAGEVVRAVITAACKGDMAACKLVLDRIVPLRRARVQFELPELHSVSDLPEAISAIMQHVADGALAPSEAGEIAALLSAQRQAFELVEIEARLRAIEARMKL